MTYAQKANRYIADVLEGRVPACRWVRLACERQKADLARKSFRWKFAEDKANRVCAFVEGLPHVEGKWTGDIRLEDWQCFLLTTVFGWIGRKSGTRRYRTAYIEVARKNAKSTLSAAVDLYMLTADGENGAQVYSAATTRDQARIVFSTAQKMARRTPDLLAHFGVDVNAHTVSVLSTGSKFAPLSSEGDTLDGLNVHCASIDELHAHRTRDVWDVLETATGARTQSLIWAITTAGVNQTGICYEQRSYVTRILDGAIDDDTYFGIIYTLDEGDEWKDEANWVKANPNYGVSVFAEDMQRLAKKASQTAAAVNNFLTKRLNVWVHASAALFDMEAWKRAAVPGLDESEWSKFPCFAAADLADSKDITATVKVYRRDDGAFPQFAAFGRYYLPEDAVENSANSQYSGWERDGHLIATSGPSTDYKRVASDILADFEALDVRELCFDPYNHRFIADPLEEGGIGESQLCKFPQVRSKMSPAIKELDTAILNGRIAHNGDPVLTWALSNVVGQYDAQENVMAEKERPENKIDPAIALIMAFARAADSTESAFERRGMVVLG
jgi:phage terminase large subunit-like protein